MTLELTAKIVKPSVDVKMEPIVIPRLDYVFVHLDGLELCVPIVVFPELTEKIAQNYVSALTKAVVIT